MSSVALHAELLVSLSRLVAAVAGDDSGVRIGGMPSVGGGWKFWILAPPELKGAFVGRNGRTAEQIRSLVRIRAAVLGSRDAIDVWVIGGTHEAPPGLFETV